MTKKEKIMRVALERIARMGSVDGAIGDEAKTIAAEAVKKAFSGKACKWCHGSPCTCPKGWPSLEKSNA